VFVICRLFFVKAELSCANFCVVLFVYLLYSSMYFCVVLCIVCFVSFSVLFVCICVLYYCHQVATQLQLNISYRITSYHIISYKKARIKILNCVCNMPIIFCYSRSFVCQFLCIFVLFFLYIFCVVLCIFVLFYVFFVLCRSLYCVYMCTVLLPPGGYPIAVKYIISYHIIPYHIIQKSKNKNFELCL